MTVLDLPMLKPRDLRFTVTKHVEIRVRLELGGPKKASSISMRQKAADLNLTCCKLARVLRYENWKQTEAISRDTGVAEQKGKRDERRGGRGSCANAAEQQEGVATV